MIIDENSAHMGAILLDIFKLCPVRATKVVVGVDSGAETRAWTKTISKISH